MSATAPGSLTDLSVSPPPAELTADVVVIGSGCGGATAARVLAEAGRDVVILEEGADYLGRLTQRDGAMYDQLYMDRGGRATADLAVSVLQGRVLGGGGVINACDVVPIPDGVLEHWGRRFGLSELTPAALRPYRERALEDLSATRVEERQVNRANALLREGARALGLRGELMLHNRVGCQGLGTCLIGCPIAAKRNPRTVSLPAAIAAGARVLTRARAVRIDDGQADVKRVSVRTLDLKGYHERGAFTVRARTVVVAAGAVNTPQLLLRSGLGNEHVGRHLTLQAQLPVIGRFDEPVDAFRGIPQAYAVTHFEQEDHPEHGLWGFRVEPIMGTPGIVASLLPFTGVEGKRRMTQLRRLAASLMLVPDAPSGRVEVMGSGRARITYTHREDHKARLREAAKVTARMYLAAGAREVLVPTLPPVVMTAPSQVGLLDALTFAPATAPLISAHQQGTARMAPSAKDGAVDPDGQVYGTRGVYVADSSVFPTSSSSHTMAPILTVSRYLAERMLARG